MPMTAAPVYFGLRPAPAGGGAGYTFAGLMDEVSIYNQALSQTQIWDIYNAGRLGKCSPYVLSVAMVNDTNADLSGPDTNKNSESEATFVLVTNASTIVAAFADTHLSAVGYGQAYFSGIPAVRSTWWSRSTNGGVSFTNTAPLPPSGRNLTNSWYGDAPNTVMAYDPNSPGTTNGTIYILCNCSREASNWMGFRLWTSTDNGTSFSLINSNIPGGNWGISNVDRPMIKVNLTNHDLIIAGRSVAPTAYKGLFAGRSPDGGATWTNCGFLDINGQSADIATTPAGAAYVTWLSYTLTNTAYSNAVRYAWLLPGSSAWSGPANLGITLNSSLRLGDRPGYRFNGDSTDDWFDMLTFPRTLFANGNIYVVYSDLPKNASTDQGDIFLAEATINPTTGALTLTGPPITVNNDQTQTDQWNPAIAVKPGGTELFIGYYSRQDDRIANSWIRAYGAKGDVRNGLANTTFDCFPISPTMFPPLFNGTNDPASMQFDPVYAPSDYLCFSGTAVVDGKPPCGNGDVKLFYDSNWFQDDNTWADADGTYFYFAWCDRTRTWTATSFNGQQYTRPDADVKLARIKQP